MERADAQWHLSERDETRARRIHDESIVIDLLFQGPLSPQVIPDALADEVKRHCEPYRDTPQRYAAMSSRVIARMAGDNQIGAFRDQWYASGITAGNRQLDFSSMERLTASMAEVQHQFDGLDWLIKALSADDIRRAKRGGVKAGIVSAQDTAAIGKDLDLLDSLYDFGLRVLQLTYNTQNFVGSGCAETADGGARDPGFGEAVRHHRARGGLLDPPSDGLDGVAERTGEQGGGGPRAVFHGDERPVLGGGDPILPHNHPSRPRGTARGPPRRTGALPARAAAGPARGASPAATRPARPAQPRARAPHRLPRQRLPGAVAAPLGRCDRRPPPGQRRRGLSP